MRLRGRLTTIPDDLPVPNGTEGEVRTVSGDTLLGTVSTTDGWYEYSQDGNPGPIYIEWDYSGVVKEQHSSVTGPSGPIDIAGIPLVFRAFSSGIIPDMGDELALTATGSSMNVSVGSGGAVVQGILYDQENSKSLAIAAAHATLPRVDALVVRVVPSGAGEDIEGKSELVIKTGTPGSGNAYIDQNDWPALTQTSALWEEIIGLIQVDAAVTTIASNKVFQETELLGVTLWQAPIVGPRGLRVDTDDIVDEAVTNDKIADESINEPKLVDGAVSNAKIADLSINEPKIVDGAVSTAKLADGAVTLAKLAAGVGVDILMPGSEYVATGGISSGSRTLVTLGVGPLQSGVQYAIFAYHGVTLRNSGSTGTVAVRCGIHDSAVRTHEFQNVGGVPRWCPVVQTHVVTGTGASIDVIGSVQYISPDTTDVRAGWIQVIAIPLSVLGGL